ncbi:P2X purinoceptor 4a-like isoform X3 [Brachyhypopomus gauderio]|uniref:P2X purinoceptor 4a-like isoform X3 n=1 Tax=Brachyhypopomus gauderio TaxID=698409 RepID=UPI004041C545
MTSKKPYYVSIIQCFFDYSTVKVLVIRSMLVGTLYRLLQAVVIVYIIGYVCVWNKGYQDTDTVISLVTTKVKGIALTNTSDLGLRIWDVADYVIPPQNPGPGSTCSSDQDCKRGLHDSRQNGVQTGRCVHFSESEKTCEVLAWCPLEKKGDPPDPPLLSEAENFTVLIKNSICYPKFSFNKRNILPHVNSSYLSQCVFDRVTDPDCPIFRLRDIAAEAGEDFQTMAVHGGVMGVQIRWDCNLDLDESRCVPAYTFHRLSIKDPENNVTQGFNIRFAKYYKNEVGKETRTLIKGYGIRFEITVFGKAGKFNIVPTLLNIGAGLGLLGLVNVVCDWIVLTMSKCNKKCQKYNAMKYEYVSFLFTYTYSYLYIFTFF